MSTNISGTEVFFDKDDIIVSKTDLSGRITYANQTFIDISGYQETELIGAPHSILRHPDMPRCVFKLLWDTLQNKQEIFAYVINKCANGDHYWVLAHVTPSLDTEGNILGYHSNRRVPSRAILDETIIPLYSNLKSIEDSHKNKKEGLQASFAALENLLQEKGVTYDALIFSL